MTKKKSRSKTPRKKSERKKKRTVKGQYYDEHLEDCISITSPVPDISGAAEEGGNGSVSPTTEIEASDLIPSDESGKEGSGPRVSTEESSKKSICADASPSGSDKDTPCVVDIDTPTPQSGADYEGPLAASIISNKVVPSQAVCTSASASPAQVVDSTQERNIPENNQDLVTSTPAGIRANNTFPLLCKTGAKSENYTPVRAVKWNDNMSLKRELELAMSFNVNQQDELQDEIMVNDDSPSNAVNMEIGVEEEIHLFEFRNLEDLYEITDHCRRTILKKEFNEIVLSQEACVYRHNMDMDNRLGGREIHVSASEQAEMLEDEKRKVAHISQVLAEEQAKSEHLLQLLNGERKKNVDIIAKVDQLEIQMVEKFQQQKKSEEEINQLRSNNVYQKEVVRLEQVIEILEKERQDLVESFKEKTDDNETIRESLSNFMNENTMLKNEIKHLRQQLSETDVQTNFPEPQNSRKGTQTDTGICIPAQSLSHHHDAGVSFGVDFGIDVGIQTDQLGCKECGEKEKLTDELIKELIKELEIIEKSVAYTQALECDQHFKQLVDHLEIIEKSLNNNEQRSEIEVSGQRDISSRSSTVYHSGTAYIPSLTDTSLSQMNRFHPLQHTSTTTHSNTLSSGEKGLPIIPGPNSYCEVVRATTRKASIFSTSITQGIDTKKLNDNFVGQRVRVHRFHGKKARHMKHYVPVHMGEDKSDTCVIVAGGNDLSDHTPVSQIANDLIEAGIVCKNHGASDIIISSVLPRSDPKSCAKREELNRVLLDLCIVHNFIYMDNWNMSSEHLRYDGVHLNRRGDDQLLSNLLWYLNG